MRFLAIALFFLLPTAAIAADTAPPTPPKPTCGTTAAECQKVVDDLTNKLVRMQRERDNYRVLWQSQGDALAQR